MMRIHDFCMEISSIKWRRKAFNLCNNSRKFIFLLPDINECEEDRHVCHRIDKNAECENKYPGFECNCRPGFEAVYNNSVDPKVLFNCTGESFA